MYAPTPLKYACFRPLPPPRVGGLVAPYRAILRYYRCDTGPRIAPYFLREVSSSPIWCDTSLLVLSFTQAHLCDTPFATYRAIIVRYPTKTSTKEFCDTIATSIARYEKYRCWAFEGGGVALSWQSTKASKEKRARFAARCPIDVRVTTLMAYGGFRACGGSGSVSWTR